MDWQDNRRQFQRALIWVAAAMLVWILWDARDALLIAFGALLTAILLRSLAGIIAAWGRLPNPIGLVLATTLVIAVIGVTLWLFGSQLTSQFSDVLKQVQAGQQSLQSMLSGSGDGHFGLTITEKGTSMITSMLTEAASLSLRFIESAVVLIITAIYLAAQPQLYREGVVAMFRPTSRPRVREVVELIEATLRRWLLGQLVLMLIVGVLTFIALLLIGVPNPIALALIAGIAEIVPYVGPFISAVPALLVALTLGFGPVLWTAIAYLLVHLVEGYVAAPLLERHFVTIPPALILIGIVAVDLIFGTIGIVLAAPITVVIYMLVKMSYVDDPLELHSGK
ncbi:MAG TPA: AI-2E family transporter [Pseudolabrys sp.]|jgi:predicted PurR-regulated permease PerM|nr:AI-2E family transporter [Pseudolabrys sp.]